MKRFLYMPSKRAQGENKSLRMYAEALEKELASGKEFPWPEDFEPEPTPGAEELGQAALEKILSGEGGSFAGPKRGDEPWGAVPEKLSDPDRLEAEDKAREQGKRKDILEYKRAVPVRIRKRSEI